MTEEEIIDALTDGWRPLDQCFLFQGNICKWDPDDQMIGTELIDDDNLRVACEQFLMKSGQCCDNIEAVRQLARRFNWPNWNR